MSDNTAISWADAVMIGRDGRVRVYRRTQPARPGQQLRRQKASEGLSWCRGCADWLPTASVSQGACRPHLNAEYRAQYAADPRPIRARVRARKSGTAPLPPLAADYLLEQFDGRCAYCPAEASTWDHVVAVSGGGQTVPGNIVPACNRCNSSKKARDVWAWLAATNRTPHEALFDVLDLLDVLAVA